MRRTTVAFAMSGALIAFSGCTADSTQANPEACAEPARAVQQQITDAARSGFVVGDSTIAELTPVRFVQVQLSKDEQNFGVVALVGVRADYHVEKPTSEAMSVFRGTEVLGVDAAGKLLVPMRTSAADAFAVAAPRDPSFAGWAHGIAADKEWNQVLTCAAG